jgi:hypothetical protein
MKNMIPIIVSIVLIACSKTKKKPSENNNYCQNNLEYLFSVPDSIPKFKIDYSLTNDLLFDFIENKLGNDTTCMVYKKFGLLVKNKVIKITYNRVCPFSFSNCGGTLRDVSNISLNNRGEVYCENEISNYDSISSKIHQKFPVKNRTYERTILKWKTKTDSKYVELAIYKIVAGYTMCYEKLAHEHLNKTLCDLNKKELSLIKRTLPFDLRFEDLVYYPRPSPPQVIP